MCMGALHQTTNKEKNQGILESEVDTTVDIEIFLKMEKTMKMWQM